VGFFEPAWQPIPRTATDLPLNAYTHLLVINFAPFDRARGETYARESSLNDVFFK
jgi:hypothetical protein